MAEPAFSFDPDGLLDDLLGDIDQELLLEAIRLAGQGMVTVVDVDPRRNFIDGIVVKRNRQYHVNVQFGDGEIITSCECDEMISEDAEFCVHGLALLIYFTQYSANLVSSSLPGLPTVGLEQPQVQARLWPEVTPAQIRAEGLNRLENLTVKELRELGEQFKVKLRGIKREEVLGGMLDVLCDPARLTTVIERLQPDTRRLLDLLSSIWDVTQISASSLANPLQTALENGQKSRPLKACLDELAPYRLWEFAPGRLRLPLGLLALRLPDPALFEAFQGQPARTAVAQPTQFSRLMLRLLLLGQTGWLSLEPAQPGGWPGETPGNRREHEIPIPPEPARLPRAVLDALQDAATPRAALHLAIRLAEALGLWVRPAPQAARKEGPQTSGVQLKPWLRLSSREQNRRLFETALGLPSSLEMDLAAQTSGFSMARLGSSELRYATYLSQLAQARLRLARLLTHVPAGQWIDLESILRTVFGLVPDGQLAFKSPPAYGIQPPESLWAVSGRKRVDTKEYLSWRKSYGLFHQAILTQTFHWLGLLDVGFRTKDDSQPVAVRLTRFGETLLGRQPDFTEAPLKTAAKPLVIQPDGTFELDPDHAPFELIQLLIQIAEPEGQPASQAAGGKTKVSFPRTLRYRMNEAGLGQAFDAGWTLDQITASLASAGGVALPDKLLRKLQPLWERYGRLQLYEDLALVQFADDYCLPELLANTRLSQILLFTFSPRLIAIRTEAAAGFVAELQTRGYTPQTVAPAPQQEEPRHGH